MSGILKVARPLLLSVPPNKALTATVVGRSMVDKLFSVNNTRNCGIGRTTGQILTQRYTRQSILPQKDVQQKKITFNEVIKVRKFIPNPEEKMSGNSNTVSSRITGISLKNAGISPGLLNILRAQGFR